ncbi:rRNA pseudouridine synthase, partial [Candidatus Saccharibacteria bacterium]|nr:rRNA pseudouridine synthase [Candidatus Saccharibacteria bacterium]
MNSPQPIRLNKFLAERLGVSRREADDLIAAGKVTVNGQTAVLGTKIDDKSKICCNNKAVSHESERIYLALNKPVGYVCSRHAQGPAPTLYELLPAKYRKLKTVGRLDKDSSGLILLTNDGDFAFRLTHPKFKKEKIYEVELDRPLAPLHQQMISDFGVEIGDGISKFTVIREATQASYVVILTEGRNRQIRRTFAAL